MTSETSTLGYVHNPVVPGMHPDPSWAYAEGRFVLATSSFALVPGLPIHVSSDLEHWDLAGYALDEAKAHEALLDYARDDNFGIFAPTIRYIDGRYIIVCTASSVRYQQARDAGVDLAYVDRVERAMGNFVLTAERVEGPWQGPFWVEDAIGGDPDIFRDDDGTWWWTGNDCTGRLWPGQCDIWTRRIDPETWRFIGERHVLWHGALDRAVWSEAPHIYRRGDWYYLATAEGGTERDHAEVFARSRSLLGPYEGNPKNPALTHRNLGGAFPVQNVGHADFAVMPDGSWWGVCLGCRETDGLNFYGREPFVFPVAWEDDWPVCSPGTGMLLAGFDAADPRSYGSMEAARYAISESERAFGSGSDDCAWQVIGERDRAVVSSALSPQWRLVPVDATDFIIALVPGHAGEGVLRQNLRNYLRWVVDENGLAKAVSCIDGEERQLCEIGLQDGRMLGVRLAGRILQVLDMPLDATVVAAVRTDRTHGEPPMMLIRRAVEPALLHTISGFPVIDPIPSDIPGTTVIAQADAAFLSTEVSGRYVGCVAGVAVCRASR